MGDIHVEVYFVLFTSCNSIYFYRSLFVGNREQK